MFSYLLSPKFPSQRLISRLERSRCKLGRVRVTCARLRQLCERLANPMIQGKTDREFPIVSVIEGGRVGRAMGVVSGAISQEDHAILAQRAENHWSLLRCGMVRSAAQSLPRRVRTRSVHVFMLIGRWLRAYKYVSRASTS